MNQPMSLIAGLVTLLKLYCGRDQVALVMFQGN